jgi:hypothetical protein
MLDKFKFLPGARLFDRIHNEGKNLPSRAGCISFLIRVEVGLFPAAVSPEFPNRIPFTNPLAARLIGPNVVFNPASS